MSDTNSILMPDYRQPEYAGLPRVLLSGGGTGGHAYPAIAIADAIRSIRPRSVIMFAGTENRMEWTAVPKAGYAIQPITVVGFHRKSITKNLAFPFKLLKGLRQSARLIRDFDPHVVVGTGGFVSGPVLRQAQRAGKPTLLQEQNAFAGAANKLLGKRANEIHLAFEEAKQYFPEGRCFISGNPTRAELTIPTRDQARTELGIPDTAKVLLMFGGSGGSAAMNAILADRVDEILKDPDTYVIWQTGLAYFDRYSESVKSHDRLRILAYLHRMDLMYAAADLVLCRAGAITISELRATATASILVPSPNVTEDHQTYNAKAVVDQKAGFLLPESEMKDQIVSVVRQLINDPDQLRSMGENARQAARPDAAETIARAVIALSGT